MPVLVYTYEEVTFRGAVMQMEKKITTLGENSFEYSFKGTRKPAVILINGAGGPLESWAKLWEAIGDDHVLFAYNRLGMGKSSKPKEAQTGLVMARDLKDLITSIGIEPPYVLVGHSLGGFVAHQFTLTYPEMVAGIVFLESSTVKDVLTDPKRSKVVNPNKYTEVDQVMATVEHIQAMDRPLNIPITVIAGNKPAFGWLMPKAKKAQRLAHQRDLLNLTESGKFVMASKSGHFPQFSEPRLVIDEIIELRHAISSNPSLR